MAKDLPASVDTQIDAAASAPVLLFEIVLDVGTLRYAATKANLVFPTAGNTYTAKAVEVTNIQQTKDEKISQVTLSFDNVSRDMAGYNNAEKFEGKAITIKKVYRDALGDASYYNELFHGYLKEPTKLDYFWMVVDAVSGSSLQERNLLEYYQTTCNHIFGDDECDRDSLADLTALTATGTADSGTTTTLVDNALTEADDFWNYGRIKITIGGVEYYRDVVDFVAVTDAITFDVELPVAVSNGDAYTVYKGCSQTWNACQANEAYGPSADNKANFFGFIHIGEQAV